jgi:hypothetical protein
MKQIDLGKYRSENAEIFSGRQRGLDVRKDAGLDSLDRNSDPVIVHIPEDVFSVNSSFFLGMFTPSIERLGGEAFKRKYRFTGKDISQVIAEAIRVTTTTESPFETTSRR